MLLPRTRYGWGSLMQDFNRLNRAVNTMIEDSGDKRGQGYPAINVWDADEKIIITSELPSINSQQLDVSITGRDLVISVKSEDAGEDENKRNYLRREIGRKSFSRTVELPCDVDAEQINARLEKGILAIQLKKNENNKARRIEIHCSE